MSFGKAKTMPNVLVTWASPDSANIGVQTLAFGAEFLANRIFCDQEKIKVSFALFNDLEHRALLSNKTLLFSLFTKKTALHSYLKGFDLILDTCGGDSFTDIYGKGRLIRIMLLQRAAAQMGIPVIMTHQTFGPFRSKAMQKVASWHLNRNENILLICRDSKSFEIASRFLNSKRLILSTDLSFYLGEKSDVARSGIAVNVSGLLWAANSHVDYLQYRSETLKLLKALLSSGLAVTIFENVKSFQDPTDDDSLPTEFLKSHFGESLSYLEPKTLFEAKQSLKKFEVVVGARMHACLNALSVGTPAVAQAYSRKFAPIFEDLGWPIGVDLRVNEFFATEVMSLIPDLSQRKSEVRQVNELAIELLESAEDRIRYWLVCGAVDTPQRNQ